MRPANNKPLLLTLALCAVGMIALAYASVPLYRLFCSATGYAGTTRRVTVASNQIPSPDIRAVTAPKVKDRSITITFDANTDGSLPWDFGPDTRSVRVKLGEVTTITYHARNNGPTPLVGTATFNVQPDKVGAYFDKIQCFCFTKQTLKPGQTISLPVQFYVDPALADDHQDDDVQNITLSYTFFRAKNQNHKISAPSASPPTEPEQHL